MALDSDFKSQPHLLRWEDVHFLSALSSSLQSFVPNQICWRREGASKVKHVLLLSCCGTTNADLHEECNELSTLGISVHVR